MQKKYQKFKKTSRKKLTKRRKKVRNTIWKEVGLTVVIILFLLAAMSVLIFALPQGEGYGMTPTISEGDRVFVNRLGKIRRFTLIYFHVPEKRETSIRRVIGLPGEQIRYKNDQLFVNYREMDEPFLHRRLNQAKQNEELLTEDFRLPQLPNTKDERIPPGKYLVLGDNRPYSSDSRYYGLIDETAIIGTVEMRIWPLHQLTSY